MEVQIHSRGVEKPPSPWGGKVGPGVKALELETFYLLPWVSGTPIPFHGGLSVCSLKSGNGCISKEEGVCGLPQLLIQYLGTGGF